MPVSFFPEIETTRLRIRPVSQSDLSSLLAVNGDDSVTRYLPYSSWQDMADAEAWYGRIMALQEKGDTFQFVMTLRDHNDAIGTCLLFRLAEQSARAEIGYALGRDHWGKGYALEAMSALIDRAFSDLSLHRLEAEIDPRNAASAKVLGRMGFVKEGLLRERWRLKGETTDSALYGLLRPEWARPASGQ
jgi:[ribosomal protein S5]-alanine N-acetyltransferase